MSGNLKFMIVKRTLTYTSIPSVWLIALLGFAFTSCDIEPSKAQTLDELHAIFEKWCPNAQFTDLSRQGAFHEDASGRHRFYRCIGHIENQLACELPDEISFTTRPGDELITIDKGTYELTLFLDYKSDAGDWRLQKIIIQSISSNSR